MNILAVSDIHNNVAVVKRLRAQETNDYDAVIVAGDLGNDGATEIMTILASFGCPVLFVLGNWDYRLPYAINFGPHGVHLHHKAVAIGHYIFTGFSGVGANWGQNPVALQLEAAVDERHENVRADAARLEREERAAMEQADAAHETAIGALDRRTADRRRKEYRIKAERIEARRWTAVRKAEEPLAKLKASPAWQAYEEDRYVAHTEVLAPNRARLAAIVQEAGPGRCVVVTHDRLVRTADDMAGVPLFMFGHRHGYADTTFRGSRFLNVSALDDKPFLIYEGPGAEEENARARSKIGTYARVTLHTHGRIDAQPVRLGP